MSDLSIITRSRAEQVYDRLRELIVRPEAEAGQRLQPMRTLAKRFGTSVPTVQRAMNQLEKEGLLIRRQGSGTFIADPADSLAPDHSVTLGVEVGADVFGDLANYLLRHLHDRNYVVSLIDTSHTQATSLLTQLPAADCLILHGNSHVLARLADADLAETTVVAVVDWESDRMQPTAAVLCDYARGVEMVYDHLRELGHERLLIVGTSSQIWCAEHPDETLSVLPGSSRRAWHGRGCSARLLTSDERAGETHIDAERFLAAFDGPEPATAIFALRDNEANIAQRLLRRHRPELLERVAIVGYYDTPWSISADPPITAVNLDVAEIARLAAEQIAAIQAGDSPLAEPIYVPPKLVIRGTSFPFTP